MRNDGKCKQQGHGDDPPAHKLISLAVGHLILFLIIHNRFLLSICLHFKTLTLLFAEILRSPSTCFEMMRVLATVRQPKIRSVSGEPICLLYRHYSKLHMPDEFTTVLPLVNVYRFRFFFNAALFNFPALVSGSSATINTSSGIQNLGIFPLPAMLSRKA